MTLDDFNHLPSPLVSPSPKRSLDDNDQINNKKIKLDNGDNGADVNGDAVDDTIDGDLVNEVKQSDGIDSELKQESNQSDLKHDPEETNEVSNEDHEDNEANEDNESNEANEALASAPAPVVSSSGLVSADGKFTVPAPKPPVQPDMNNLPSNPIPSHQQKFALNTIKSIKRLRDSNPFLHPVDIIKLNIPFYYNYIPNPIDLSTIEKKLIVSAYSDSKEIVEDFNLMINNCKKFNGENSPITKMALNIQAHFEKHMLNFPPKILPSNSSPGKIISNQNQSNMNHSHSPKLESDEDSVALHRPKRVIHPPKSKELPYDTRPRTKKFAAELRYAQQTLKELINKKHASYNFPFLQPVDIIALNIPHYTKIVKNPMDLSTVQTKLSNNKYENGDDFYNDVKLIFKNCYLFNPDGTEVNLMGKKLEAIFEKKWSQKPLSDPSPDNSDYDSDFYNDDDEEFNERILSEVPAIQFLENQLIRMKKELEDLKRDHLKKIKEQKLAKRRKQKQKSRKGSKSNGSFSNQNSTPVVTYEMKKQVSEVVPNLSDKKLQALIKIIKDDIEIGNDDEVELDMDQLEDRTVLKLFNFLFGNKALQQKKKKKSSNYQGGHEELISLRNQLALFDNDDQMGGLMNIGNNIESSEDDLSSESSEEE